MVCAEESATGTSSAMAANTVTPTVSFPLRIPFKAARPSFHGGIAPGCSRVSSTDTTSVAATNLTEQLWGAETTKAVDNFPVSGERVPVPVVRWLGRLKAAAAEANAALGLLADDLAERIAAPGRAVAAGGHDDQFPIDVFQT